MPSLGEGKPPTQREVDVEAQGMSPGHVFDERYLIESELGRGGTCIVYRAIDLEEGTPCALKAIYHWNISAERFWKAHQCAVALQMPGVVRVLRASESRDGRLYQVMELLQGETLHSRVQRDGTLPVGVVTSLVSQLLSTLAGIHEAGFVHGGLALCNLWLRAGARDVELVLIDFGTFRPVSTLREVDGDIAGAVSLYRLCREPLGVELKSLVASLTSGQPRKLITSARELLRTLQLQDLQPTGADHEHG